MKYSIFFIAFVVMAAVNVSALPADAIKPTLEIDDLSHHEKHASPVVSHRPGFGIPDDPLGPSTRP
ncbi:BZ3500_MvSof-1268-A1-R1_Chr7-3g09698 [Microbotryum saponariae]|uniref:BZ3500_MvSof-1268-A1-R1_Chr7-3g09698 protein n=1 Tax=Microbotryum saponariae TaxID=289078 RepID=A0A2X0L188_9BASI|nr:BZ3501_MvSof-1269-A2-R1_Chr7-2g09421 [Microbotryum saponariae]SDA02435.1 BZ3500_MvSof-1268-A1-R1_Chr7-3g09698 [Microbotryum saponariae]